MELKIIDDQKNKLVFEIKGESHTIANALRKELWNDSHVKVAGYSVEHPILDIPRFILETDGADPRKTIKAAINRLEKQLAKVKDEAKKIK
jgi:DNA-directed RNA polymerase subunit L